MTNKLFYFFQTFPLQKQILVKEQFLSQIKTKKVNNKICLSKLYLIFKVVRNDTAQICNKYAKGLVKQKIIDSGNLVKKI